MPDDFDVVVIGGGLGGLSAAALLARSGHHVALVEKNEQTGGCAQAFQRGEYTFDPAIHFTIDAGPGGFTPTMLDHLGVADQVTFCETDLTYRALYPELTVDAPPGREAFLAEHQRLFPQDAEGLGRLFEMRQALFAQLAALPQKVDPRGLEDALAAAPLVFKYRMATVADVLDEYLDDSRAKAAVASIWPYVGSPPERMSFLLFNQMLESMHAGTYTAIGGFQTLADALTKAIADHGGTVLCGEPVTSILVDDGRARGVEIGQGRRLSAGAVVSNVDARHTFETLVGQDHLPGSLARTLARHRLSPSAFVLYGTFDTAPSDLGLDSETFINTDWDHEATWAGLHAGEPGGIWISAPSLVDDTLAPSGTELGIITSLTPPEADGSWRSRREDYALRLLATVEQMVPGVTDSFNTVDIATPDTFARYTGSAGGAAYGWENIPSQTASKRLPHRTPLPGLFLSGHWAEEGTSSLRVLTSGRATAALVAGDLRRGDPVPDFGGPSFLDSERADR